MEREGWVSLQWGHTTLHQPDGQGERPRQIMLGVNTLHLMP